MARGKFIVFEGIDGSGKGTIIKLVKNYLETKNKAVVVTAEPTSGKFGKKARELQSSDSDPLSNAKQCLEFYVKDREEHLNGVIDPALKKGKIVLCDRYKHSTAVYQSLQGISIEEILELNKEFTRPDLVLLFDLPVEIALERIVADKTRETKFQKFEKKEFLEKVRRRFLLLYKNQIPDLEKFVRINANQSVEEVFEEVKQVLEKEFGF